MAKEKLATFIPLFLCSLPLLTSVTSPSFLFFPLEAFLKMKNDKKYIALFSDCFLVKGASMPTDQTQVTAYKIKPR